MKYALATKRKERNGAGSATRTHDRQPGFILPQMRREWWFMNGELAAVLENSCVGRRSSEDAGLTWSDTVSAADTLAGPLAPWPLCIFTRHEYPRILSSAGIRQSRFTHITHVCVWASVYDTEWHRGKNFLFFFALFVYFSLNDS